MAASFKLELRGMKEFRADLRGLDKALLKELQKENKLVANEVAGHARAAYTGMHKQFSGRGASSIRGLASQTRAQVAIGSARAPYMLGQEFGANRYEALGGGMFGGGMEATGIKTQRGRSSRVLFTRIGSRRKVTKSSMRQFPPYKLSASGRGGEGYFFFPALRKAANGLPERYGKVLDRIAAKAFPKGGA